MKHAIIFIFTLLCATNAFASDASKGMWNRNICVFDPAGQNGDITTMAKDVATEYLSYGVNLTVRSYFNDLVVRSKFKSGECDSMLILGYMAREFSHFAASIEAPGLFADYSYLHDFLATLYQPKYADNFVSASSEVMGIYPVGIAYFLSRDKREATVASIANRRLFLNRAVPDLKVLAEITGSKTTYGNNSNFAKRFNESKSDLVTVPLAIADPLGMKKTLEEQGGGVIDMPFMLFTLQVVTHRGRFPPKIGQKAREQSLSALDGILDIVQQHEKAMESLMIPLTEAQTAEWQSVFDRASEKMIEMGEYSPKMLKVARKFRCAKKPQDPICQ